MDKKNNLVAEVVSIILLAMVAFAVWFVDWLLYLPHADNASTEELGNRLVRNLRSEKIYLPENATTRFFVAGEKNSCEVSYAYYSLLDSDIEIGSDGSLAYDIERDTFESWLNDYVINDVIADGSKKAKIAKEYLPDFDEKEKYYCFMFKTTIRLVYVYVVYDETDKSLIVCRQTTPYPNEKSLAAGKFLSDNALRDRCVTEVLI